MTALEIATADALTTGITPNTHPVQFLGAHLIQLGAHTITQLHAIDAGTRVLVGGAITHRQRPATAGGITFLNLEDETGMLNIICTLGLWRRYNSIVRHARPLLIRGILEHGDGNVTSLLADHLDILDLKVAHSSRDFR